MFTQLLGLIAGILGFGGKRLSVCKEGKVSHESLFKKMAPLLIVLIFPIFSVIDANAYVPIDYPGWFSEDKDLPGSPSKDEVCYKQELADWGRNIGITKEIAEKIAEKVINKKMDIGLSESPIFSCTDENGNNINGKYYDIDQPIWHMMRDIIFLETLKHSVQHWDEKYIQSLRGGSCGIDFSDAYGRAEDIGEEFNAYINDDFFTSNHNPIVSAIIGAGNTNYGNLFTSDGALESWVEGRAESAIEVAGGSLIFKDANVFDFDFGLGKSGLGELATGIFINYYSNKGSIDSGTALMLNNASSIVFSVASGGLSLVLAPAKILYDTLSWFGGEVKDTSKGAHLVNYYYLAGNYPNDFIDVSEEGVIDFDSVKIFPGTVGGGVDDPILDGLASCGYTFAHAADRDKDLQSIYALSSLMMMASELNIEDMKKNVAAFAYLQYLADQPYVNIALTSEPKTESEAKILYRAGETINVKVEMGRTVPSRNVKITLYNSEKVLIDSQSHIDISTADPKNISFKIPLEFNGNFLEGDNFRFFVESESDSTLTATSIPFTIVAPSLKITNVTPLDNHRNDYKIDWKGVNLPDELVFQAVQDGKVKWTAFISEFDEDSCEIHNFCGECDDGIYSFCFSPELNGTYLDCYDNVQIDEDIFLAKLTYPTPGSVLHSGLTKNHVTFETGIAKPENVSFTLYCSNGIAASIPSTELVSDSRFDYNLYSHVRGENFYLTLNVNGREVDRVENLTVVSGLITSPLDSITAGSLYTLKWYIDYYKEFPNLPLYIKLMHKDKTGIITDVKAKNSQGQEGVEIQIPEGIEGDGFYFVIYELYEIGRSEPFAIYPVSGSTLTITSPENNREFFPGDMVTISWVGGGDNVRVAAQVGTTTVFDESGLDANGSVQIHIRENLSGNGWIYVISDNGRRFINFTVRNSTIAIPVNELSVCIDRSGSMEGTKLELAKRAAELLVNLTHCQNEIKEPATGDNILVAGDHFSVTVFDMDGFVAFPLSEMSFDNKVLALDAIDEIIIGPWTSVGAGLIKSRDTFTLKNVPKSVVLLSDGEENTSPYVKDVKQSLIDKGIRVFCVGLGSGADENLLNTLANETDAQYFFAKDEHALPFIFSTLYDNVRDEGLLKVVGGSFGGSRRSSSRSERYTISPESFASSRNARSNTASHRETVKVDGSVGEVTFLAIWDQGNATVALQDPDGNSITSQNFSSFQDISYIEGTGYAMYRLLNKNPGDWKVHLTFDYASEVQWELKVYGIGNGIRLEAETDKSTYSYLEPVKIQAVCKAPQPVIRGIATAVVVRPDGFEEEVSLYDNGNADNGDEFANDGIYAGMFGSFVGEGVYTVTVKFDSTGGTTLSASPEPVPSFERYKQFTFFVNNDDVSYDFKAGTFIVGKEGQVRTDWLYDGGAYQGELGIFSLSGMNNFTPNSPEFIEEATRRALSESELGCIVLSDKTQGARFSGQIGNSTEPERNSGEYKGIKTCKMIPGDIFATILVPNSTLESLYEDSDTADLYKRPIFSLASSNPEHEMYFGQIAKIKDGDSEFVNAVVYEDMLLSSGSDRDYNDLIVHFSGVTLSAPTLDNPELGFKDDWRKSQNPVIPHIEVSPPSPETLWITITLKSPADLFVYDPQGNVIGKEGGDIPGATFETDANGHQIVSLPKLDSGEYRVVLRAIGEGGLCHLEVKGYKGDSELAAKETPFTIGAHETFTTMISADDFLDKTVIAFSTPDIAVSETGESLNYDFNGDGRIDDADIERVSLLWNTCAGDEQFDPFFDLDDDGCITVKDIMQVGN